MEGRRALVTELQALVGSDQPSPRRASSGLDSQRVSMMLAVVERRLGLKLAGREVYTSTVGGVRIAEPASDLALAIAVCGAARDEPVRPGLVAIGEVGLAGEIRPVSALHARLTEAARLGFDTAVVPPHASARVDGLSIIEAADLRSAVHHAFVTG
jgi:DNA repair protein RadA/Sms